MKEIPLTNWHEKVLVDDEDYEYLMQWKWYRTTNRNGDAYAWTTTTPIKQMHRLIMGEPKGLRIDHINHNGLDNQRHNLREATASQNGQNRKGAAKHSSTGVRGVYWNKKRKKYQAFVYVYHKPHYFGAYETLAEAEQAVIAGRQSLMTHTTN